ncbi:MAG: hypothetical protein KDD62_03695, partial [Bdellovibrionales bacterium]|nr:hypothetical protein [Bdellovibrionales bacterium]
MNLQKLAVRRLNDELRAQNLDCQFTLTKDELRLELPKIPIKDSWTLSDGRGLKPNDQVKKELGEHAYHEIQYGKMALVRLGFMKSQDATDILAPLSTSRDPQYAQASMSIPISQLDLRSEAQRYLNAQPVAILSREELLLLLDKSFLASTWTFKAFKERHGELAAQYNGAQLYKDVLRGDTLIFRESKLIEFLGPAARERYPIMDAGRLPDSLDGIIGHSLVDHRVFVDGESFLVFRNQVRHEYFPIGGPGTVARKHEHNNALTEFIDTMSGYGAGMDFHRSWRNDPEPLAAGALRVLPSKDDSIEMSRNWMQRIDQMLSQSVSNFHIDIGRGQVVTNFLISAFPSELLAERLSTQDLRELLALQRNQAEEFQDKVLSRVGVRSHNTPETSLMTLLKDLQFIKAVRFAAELLKQRKLPGTIV